MSSWYKLVSCYYTHACAIVTKHNIFYAYKALTEMLKITASEHTDVLFGEILKSYSVKELIVRPLQRPHFQYLLTKACENVFEYD